MKKLFKILTLSTMCLGMPLLNACSFFRGNDNKTTGIKEILVDYDDDGNGERLSVYEAAEIWASKGKDEDYMFGYSEDELEDAL